MKLRIFFVFLLFCSLSSAQIDTSLFNEKIEKTRISFSKSQDSVRFYLNQAEQLANQGNYKHGKLRVGYYQCLLLSRENKHTEAIKLAQSFMKECDTSEFDKLKISYLRFIGLRYKDIRNNNKAHFYYDEAISLASSIRDTINLSNVLFNKATLLEMENQLEDALTIFLQVMEIDKQSGNLRNVSSTLKNISFIYRKIGNYQQAISSIEKAIAIDSIGNNYYNLSGGYSNLASTYNDMSLLTNSLNYFLKSDKYAELSKSPRLISSTKLNIGYIKNKLEDYSGSIEYLIESKKYTKKGRQRMKIHYTLANNYTKLGQYNKAKQEYELSEKYWSDDDELSSKIARLTVGAELYEGIGNTDKALVMMNQAFILRDSLNNFNKKELTARIEAEYQGKLKDAEIKSLSQENALKQTKLRASRNLMFTVLGILGLITLLLLQQLRKRKIVKIKNNRISLFSREIVHRTQNQITLIANLITNQKQLIGVLSSKELIEDIDCKVRALSEVNRSLETNEDQTKVSIMSIFKSILENNAYGLSKSNIKVIIVGDNVKMDGAKVSQLALVINELSTNSIKYAINKVENPEIEVEIKKFNDQLSIVYMDNGKTKPNSVNNIGQGTELIQGIIYHLGGEIEDSFTEDGYKTTIKIPIDDK